MIDLRRSAPGQAGISFAMIFVCCGILWAAVLPGRAQEAGEGDTATTIRAMETQRFAAQSRRDSRALELILDNDVVYIESGRPLNKGEYLSQLKGAGAPPAATLEAMTVKRFGDAAIVVGSYREKHPPGAKTSAEQWRFEDTWVHKAEKWVLVSSAASPEAK